MAGGGDVGGTATTGGGGRATDSARVITVDAGVVAADLVDFPMAVIVAGDVELRSSAAAWFTTVEGVALSYEIESLDAMTGDLAAWVRVPLLSATAATKIVLHLGNTTPADAPESPQTVWAEYAGVWHLNDDGWVDSTANDNNASVEGSPPLSTGGVVGAGALFSGNELLTMGDPSDGILDPGSGSFTYAVWVHVQSSLGNYDMPWHKGGACANCPGYDMELGAQNWSAWVGDGNNNTGGAFGAEGEFLNRWVQLLVVVDRGANNVQLYADGVPKGSSSLAGIGAIQSQYEATLGHTSYMFNGRLDEVRVRNAASSAAWVAAVHDNITAPDSFYSMSAR
jgi:hypothetical protein